MGKKEDGQQKEKVVADKKSVTIVGTGGYYSKIDRKPGETLGDALARHREENQG